MTTLTEQQIRDLDVDALEWERLAAPLHGDKAFFDWQNGYLIQYNNGEWERAKPVFKSGSVTQNNILAYADHKAATDAISEITQERGKNYGKPINHFTTCQKMYDIWEIRFAGAHPETIDLTQPNLAVQHGVHWIIDKLVRAAENPMHKDNWDDIEGYARCIKDALGLEEMK